MTRPAFDDIIHAPNRLQICAMLAPVDALDFATVRESLSVSDSVLSKHVRVLTDVGYLHTAKTRHASRSRTWLSLTDTGRAALHSHLAELRRISALATVQTSTSTLPGTNRGGAAP
ncbi:transcriptional regulator [Georgenia sunbinii]|uniref:transcriptional regulator n=1 Tax=Georgenia sunbinii TaxID=3117728 RepID=UPI002F263B62